MVSKERFNEELDSIVKQIIVEYNPEKIILFGSLLNGVIDEGTDIDLFIVKKDVPHIGVERIRELGKLIDCGFATDFIVYTPEELQKRLMLNDPFVKNIVEEGKVLYDAA